MNKNSNTLFGSKQSVKTIVEAEPALYGAAPSGSNTAVRFAYHEGEAIAKGADGQLVFNKLGNTGAIYLGDILVSSKILDVTYAPKTNASAGVNLVSVKFLKEDGSIDVSTFEVVDENAVKAWLADTSISAAGDSYINAAVNATDNKKIDVSANVATPDKVKDLTDGKVALADAASFLDYIDTKAAAGTTEVVAAAGVNVAKSTNEADKHTVYTVGANLVFQYNAAVPASEGKVAVPATITLKSAVRDGEAQVTYGTVNVSDIIGNGILASHSYEKTTGILTLNFKQADGSIKAESINLADMLDIDDVVIGDESANYLNVTLNATENGNDTNHNMALDVKIKKMAEVADAVEGSDEGEAKAAVTGLADALDVRNFVLEKVKAVDDSIKALDVEETAVNATNASFKYSETDGIISIRDFALDYSRVEKTPTTSTADAPKTDASIAVADGSKLAVGSDIEKVAQYAADKVTEEMHRVDAKIAALRGDVTSDDNAVANVEVKTEGGQVSDVIVTTISAGVNRDGDAQGARKLAATTPTGALVGSDVALIKGYVDDKIADVTGAQDSAVTVHDTSSFITATITMKDGSLNQDESSLSYVKAVYANDSNTVTTNGLVDGQLALDMINDRIADLDKAEETKADDNEYVSISLKVADGLASITSVAVKTHEVSTATADNEGLATAYSTRNYIDTRLTWAVI